MQLRTARTVALLVLFLLLGLTGTAGAQVLPIPQEPRSSLDHARYVNEVRGELERTLQEWVNAGARGDAEAVSRFYTDEALVVDPSGEVVRGRPAIAAYWADRSPAGPDLAAAITHVSATNTMAAARGRVALGAGRSGEMLMVFERQRGVWLTRVHSIALDPPTAVGPVTSLPRAIRPTGQEPRVPELPQIRWRVEPFTGLVRFADDHGRPTAAVAGLGGGLEVGRAFELRLGYWRGVGDAAPAGATGEIRFYGLPDASARPYLLAGAAHVTPGGVPGEVAPMAGGGLGVDLPGRWGAHLDARTYLLSRPGAHPADHWINEDRAASWSITAGASFAIGRYREWRDPPVTATRQAYEEIIRHDLAGRLGQWLAESGAGTWTRPDELYAPDARLVTSDGLRAQGPRQIAEYWANGIVALDGSLVYEDLRASGHVAALVARIVPTGDADDETAVGGALVTVFEQAGGKWTIRSQMLNRTPAEPIGP